MSAKKDCLYVERVDGSWAHSLFCPVHMSRGGMALGDEGWPLGPDCERLHYATGPVGLDPDAPPFTQEA